MEEIVGKGSNFKTLVPGKVFSPRHKQKYDLFKHEIPGIFKNLYSNLKLSTNLVKLSRQWSMVFCGPTALKNQGP